MPTLYLPENLKNKVEEEAEKRDKKPYEVIADDVNGEALTPEQEREVRELIEEYVQGMR